MARACSAHARPGRVSAGFPVLTTRVVHWFPNFLAGGGVANSVLALAEAQAAAGVDVWIATLSHDDAMYGPPDLSAMRVVVWNGGRPIRCGAVQIHVMHFRPFRALRSLRPDVVHVHGEFNPDNWWVPRVWPCPVVLSPHGAFHPTVLSRGGAAKRAYISVARRVLYRNVARFHALSPAEQSDIAALLPTAKVYWASQGASPAVQAELEWLEPQASHGRAGPIQFMFIGRVDVQTKGLDVLVEAFAKAVRGDAPQRRAKLTIVGPDWRNGKRLLLELALRLGIDDLIEIRDAVAGVEVAAVLEGCDVYVQLSRNEGSPLSLNDALALGKPAIVSDRIGTISCHEIKNLPHVKIVEPSVAAASQAIADMLANLDDLKRVAQELRPGVRDFLSWQRAAARHLAEYAVVLDR